MKTSFFRRVWHVMLRYQFVFLSHQRRRLPCECRTMLSRMHWWYHDKTSALIASGEAFVWSSFLKHTLPVALQMCVSHRTCEYPQHVLLVVQTNTCICWSVLWRNWILCNPTHIFRILVRVDTNLQVVKNCVVLVLMIQENTLVRLVRRNF